MSQFCFMLDLKTWFAFRHRCTSSSDSFISKIRKHIWIIFAIYIYIWIYFPYMSICSFISYVLGQVGNGWDIKPSPLLDKPTFTGHPWYWLISIVNHDHFEELVLVTQWLLHFLPSVRAVGLCFPLRVLIWLGEIRLPPSAVQLDHQWQTPLCEHKTPSKTQRLTLSQWYVLCLCLCQFL